MHSIGFLWNKGSISVEMLMELLDLKNFYSKSSNKNIFIKRHWCRKLSAKYEEILYQFLSHIKPIIFPSLATHESNAMKRDATFHTGRLQNTWKISHNELISIHTLSKNDQHFPYVYIMHIAFATSIQSQLQSTRNLSIRREAGFSD